MAESWRAGGFHCTHQGLLSQTQDAKWDDSFRRQLTSFYLTVPPRHAMQPPCPLSAAPCEWGHVLASCFPSYHCRPHTSYLARATLAHAGRPAAHYCLLDLHKTPIHAACHSIPLSAPRSLQCPLPRQDSNKNRPLAFLAGLNQFSSPIPHSSPKSTSSQAKSSIN